MTRSERAFRAALAAVEELRPRLQREIVRRLVALTTRDGHTTVVYLQQPSARRRQRLADLMDKSNAGRLTRAERAELNRLGAEVQRLMLANSQALACAARPELFDAGSEPVPHRFREALREASAMNVAPKEQPARA